MPENIQHLLDSIKPIVEKYDEIARETGENYNIFSVMGMATDEVYTHSRIIGNLLNPKGSHDMGSIFLDEFVNNINLKLIELDFPEYSLNKFGVLSGKIVERGSGKINTDKTEGGRIDIIIEDKNQCLIIENKIYANDQKNQLLRYSNYKLDKKCLIVYLTLDGRNLQDNNGNEIVLRGEGLFYSMNFEKSYKKSDSSEIEIRYDKLNFKDKNKVIYLPISYETFIKDWIQYCQKQVFNKPMIREVLRQYEFLINRLTNQTNKAKMAVDILKQLESKTEFESLSLLFKEWNKIRVITETLFWKELQENLRTCGFTCVQNNSSFSEDKIKSRTTNERKKVNDFGITIKLKSTLNESDITFGIYIWTWAKWNDNIHFYTCLIDESNQRVNLKENQAFVHTILDYFGNKNLEFKQDGWGGNKKNTGLMNGLMEFTDESVIKIINKEERKKIIESIVNQLEDYLLDYPIFSR